LVEDAVHHEILVLAHDYSSNSSARAPEELSLDEKAQSCAPQDCVVVCLAANSK
jgi:hypothetical protein